jgi:glycosyltransferase involved in cell wall biosynthesis
VHLVGYRDDIRYCYDQFDLFAMPSRTEPFGLVLLEAMMAGCPILSTRSEGPSDILSNNLQVIWAECHNADSLQQALQAARPVMGERWVYHELGNHSFERASRAVLRFYETLIEKHQTHQKGESAVA